MANPDDARMGKILASSATGTSLLILIQLASRIFTFASNQLILRTLSPVVLGIAAQLELFQVSILYFSRESIRMAIQRQPIPFSPDNKKISLEADFEVTDSQSVASQAVVNVSYLSLALGIPASLMFTMLYQCLVPEEASNTAFFYHSVILIGASSLMELSIEPFFSVVQQHMLYEKRAAVEMPAAFLRSAVTSSAFICASQVNHDLGVLPFALGHLSYSLALICGYSLVLLRGTNTTRFSFSLTRIQSRNPSNYFLGRFSRELTSLAANVFFQSLVKHLLTQGDTMMLVALSGLEDQGIYSLASNYGGLIARIIFQPLEESSRNLFSALLSRGVDGKLKNVHIHTAKNHLVDILRAYQVMSILIFPLGPMMVPQLLHILGGRLWASPKTRDLLSVYCYYIPFLAFNGITEAFVSSAANSQQIRKQTAWMGFFSACYALAAYMFLEVGNLGAYGLVLANIVNMVVRTFWSYSFIKSYLHRNGCSLYTKEVAIRPASFILSALASLFLGGFGLQLGIIKACVLSGSYALLM
ncbi:RFT1 [Penicillium digitatum]|uniref:Man(5)GlcNAc(2)-PP-dolichol translocation protein RFT1 n=1 Tax=Penicillium digitatum TaxID=36651 RepID=A0A7T7BL50_PENDI|nr:RFT1 [Penicillium digitatum]